MWGTTVKQWHMMGGVIVDRFNDYSYHGNFRLDKVAKIWEEWDWDTQTWIPVLGLQEYQKLALEELENGHQDYSYQE